MTEPDTGATAAGGTGGLGTGGGTNYGTTGQNYRQDTDYRTTGYETGTVPVREERLEPQTVQTHQERVVHHNTPVSQGSDSRPVNVAVGAERHDGVRWGPIWAGLLTALTTFLLLELLFFALDVLDLTDGNQSGIVTGILALVAFFLGGLVAGATALWKGVFSGLLHGFLVWALGVVAFIALTFFGAGTLLGSFGSLTNQLGVGPQAVQSATDVNATEAKDARQATKDAAAPAFWGLFAPLAASMVGGLIGGRIWPRKEDTEASNVQVNR